MIFCQKLPRWYLVSKLCTQLKSAFSKCICKHPRISKLWPRQHWVSCWILQNLADCYQQLIYHSRSPKKQHISNQISFFGKDTEDTAGHTGHIDEDHPVPMKSEARCVQKRNITSVPEGLEHTHTKLFIWQGWPLGQQKANKGLGRREMLSCSIQRDTLFRSDVV